MNAYLLLTVCIAGADAGAAPVATAAPVVVSSGSGCGGCGPTVASSCDSCSKVSLLDKLRARFAKSNSCGCEKSTSCCDKAPKCEKAPKCKPACGTPLFSRTSCSSGCSTGGCSGTCDSCDKPSLLDKLKARWASRKHSSDCAPSCGGCAAAPAGCALPPAQGTAPSTTPANPPKTMEKKTSSYSAPMTLTPASNIVPAPMPTPVLGSSKSPF